MYLAGTELTVWKEKQFVVGCGLPYRPMCRNYNTW